jgi:hypothetical protein
LVEDLDQLVVGARLRQELGGRGEGLARARGRTEPGLRIRLQQSGHDLPQRFGNALGRTRCPVLSEVLHERPGVRLGALQQIEGDQADGEQVGGEVRFRAHQLFGRDVTRRADHEVGIGQPWLAQSHRDAEVRQPQPGQTGAGRLQEHVGRLDVAVHDPLRVHRREPRQKLVEQGADERRRQRPVVPDQVDQRATGHQVHGEQHLVVVGGPTGRGQHVRVVDPQRLFPHETQQGVRVALLQDLGGHVPSAAVVPGAPDRADAAASDRVGQLVPAGEDLTHGCASLLPLRLAPVHAPRRAIRPPPRQFWCDW